MDGCRVGRTTAVTCGSLCKPAVSSVLRGLMTTGTVCVAGAITNMGTRTFSMVTVS